MATNTPPTTPPVRPNSHTIEYTINLDTFDQQTLDYIKSRIVDELTRLLNAAQPQIRPKFSRSHFDRVSL
jgi:hypothetical protein